MRFFHIIVRGSQLLGAKVWTTYGYYVVESFGRYGDRTITVAWGQVVVSCEVHPKIILLSLSN